MCESPCLLRRHQQTDFRSTCYILEKAFVFSSVLLLNRCFVFFLLEPVDFTRSALSYLGQIAPVAVFTAREGARSVYPGVFGRAVLATLPIGLPRPFLLLRAADIGPTVKTHCLFPPPLREPDGHATYRDDTMGGVGACVLSVAYYARSWYILPISRARRARSDRAQRVTRRARRSHDRRM